MPDVKAAHMLMGSMAGTRFDQPADHCLNSCCIDQATYTAPPLLSKVHESLYTYTLAKPDPREPGTA